MVKPIMHDPLFLAGKSEAATAEDLSVARDLLDTLLAHQQHCVGLAANMIGVRKRVIALFNGPAPMAMMNPVITKKSGAYEAEEGCLSLSGVRKTTRYERIEVSYQDMQMKQQRRSFTGYTAQIIQHEVDHCDGILI